MKPQYSTTNLQGTNSSGGTTIQALRMVGALEIHFSHVAQTREIIPVRGLRGAVHSPWSPWETQYSPHHTIYHSRNPKAYAWYLTEGIGGDF